MPLLDCHAPCFGPCQPKRNTGQEQESYGVDEEAAWEVVRGVSAGRYQGQGSACCGQCCQRDCHPEGDVAEGDNAIAVNDLSLRNARSFPVVDSRQRAGGEPGELTSSIPLAALPDASASVDAEAGGASGERTFAGVAPQAGPILVEGTTASPAPASASAATTSASLGTDSGITSTPFDTGPLVTPVTTCGTNAASGGGVSITSSPPVSLIPSCYSTRNSSLGSHTVSRRILPDRMASLSRSGTASLYRLRRSLSWKFMNVFDRCFAKPLGFRDAVQRPSAVLVLATTVSTGIYSFLSIHAAWERRPATILCGTVVGEELSTAGPDVVDEVYFDSALIGFQALETLYTSLLASWLLWTVWSVQLRRNTVLVTMAWLKAWATYMYYVTEFTSHGLLPFFILLHTLVEIVFGIAVFYRAWSNLGLLERGMLRSLGLRHVRYFCCMLALLSVIVTGVVNLWHMFVFEPSASGTASNASNVDDAGDDGSGYYEEPAFWIGSVSVWCIFVGWFSTVALLTVSTWRGWRFITSVAKHVVGEDEQAEARNATLTSFQMTVLTFLSLNFSVINAFVKHVRSLNVWPIKRAWRDNWVCKASLPLNFLDTLTNIMLALVFSGIFTDALGHNQAGFEADRERKIQRRKFMEVKARKPCTEGKEWHRKVEDLSNRGFTLLALLNFYRGLGRDYMLHFDPLRSTTSDVVANVVIPASASDQCAYAVIMMNGVPTKPGTMVTHAWSNLFGDLVAAVVAHALEETSFEFAHGLMLQDFDRLEKLLRRINALEKTYWICAFSVNQHAGICDFPDFVDSVTGEKTPPCQCKLEKAWNTTPPLLPDGRSIPCEMNKFDGMMQVLAASDEDFSQVVCLDRDCKTLARCWCVAEIVEAQKSLMKQTIQVHSAATIRDHTADLSNLRVENMKATNPADIAMILDKIPDKQSFNEKYCAIVRDAVEWWEQLADEDRIVRAGRFWLHTFRLEAKTKSMSVEGS